jgi:hypothetical protein
MPHSPDQERVLKRVNKLLGLDDFDEKMAGWAVVESPCSRWLGKLVHAGYEVGAPSWLGRVNLNPAFVLPSPEVVTLRYDEIHHQRDQITGQRHTKVERNVGAGLGQGCYTMGAVLGFQLVEQIHVCSITRSENWSEAYRGIMFGNILERIGILDEEAQKAAEHERRVVQQ